MDFSDAARKNDRKRLIYVAAAIIVTALALLAGRAFATTSAITIRLLDGTTVGTAGCSVTGAALSVPAGVLAGSIDCRADQIFRDSLE